MEGELGVPTYALSHCFPIDFGVTIYDIAPIVVSIHAKVHMILQCFVGSSLVVMWVCTE